MVKTKYVGHNYSYIFTNCFDYFCRISELIEKETEAYYRTDPDPFDDRHPIRTRPNSPLGVLLKNIFREDDFITRLVNSYLLHRDNVELQTVSCRLMYVLLPGMELAAVFNETEHIISRLYQWAETGGEPLRSYATGLLATAMTIPEMATLFKDDNMRLVPIMLRRLKELSCMQDLIESTSNQNASESVANDSTNCNSDMIESISSAGDQALTFAKFQSIENGENGQPMEINTQLGKKRDKPDDNHSPPEFHSAKRRKEISRDNSLLQSNTLANNSSLSINNNNSNQSFRSILSPGHGLMSECSNSSWAELEPYMIGTFRMFPLSVEMQQRFILEYLTPMGDYQELLCHVFENDALRLICHYIDLQKNKDIKLAFVALRYLASLLCHKKFSLEFLRMGGLQLLLQVYRPSVAATGVSLCLYFLAYNEDAMEYICLQPKSLLNDLVNYAIWLLECSHGSSRCHSTNFFSVSFAFRAILDLFDSQDGLRRLFNVLFMLNFFDEEESDATDDELLLKQQTARHVCVALRKYFETHLLIECEQLRRSAIAKHHHLANNTHIMQCINKLNIGSIPTYKAIKYTPETIAEFIEALLELMPLRKTWKPVEELISLGGVKLFLNMIFVSEYWSFSGKIECVKCALDVLVVASAIPKLQMALIEELTLFDVNMSVTCTTTGIAMLLDVVDGLIINDADVQCSALQVLVNCCCAPLNRIGSSSIRLFANQSSANAIQPSPATPKLAIQCNGGTSSTGKRNRTVKQGEDLLHRLWEAVRNNNGILILLKLLSVKVPITHADKLRALACQTLCGMARNKTVKQILGKLPIFTTGELQMLMREPIVHERRLEHMNFIRHCIKLIELVTGIPISQQVDSAVPAYFNRAEVVAQTKITYNQKELLQLIHKHLNAQGFNRTAKLLLEEANLVCGSHTNPLTWPTNTPPSKQSFSSSRKRSSKRRPYLINDCTSSPNALSLRSNKSSDNQTPARHTLATPLGNKTTIHMQHTGFTPIRSNALTPHRAPSAVIGDNVPNQVSLDNIVTEYLRKQHSQCTHPVHTCPPFDLFQPHRCPAPSNRNSAPLNCARRYAQRQIQPRFGGVLGPKYDRQLIYSKFRPIRTFRESESSSSVTSCAFSHVQQFLFLGTLSGDLVLYNLNTCSLEASYQCHQCAISSVEPSKDGQLVLTCSEWRRPTASLWTFTDLFEFKMNFNDNPYAEFAKQSKNRAIATKGPSAQVFDLEVGTRIQTFYDKRLSNKYKKNKATFNYSDDLVLNDGVLWDVRSSAHVHKFDKFNRNMNGVFHPNNWQIVANSEVWDMRTYRLLHTVPALDQCHITFNETGDVIYGAMFEDGTLYDDDMQVRSPYCSSIRTFDAHDFSNISVFDVKRVIHDMSVDRSDSFLAVVENIQVNSQQITSDESICKLYEIGRCKEDGEDDEDDDDDEDIEEDDDSDDDDEDEEEEDEDDDDDTSSDGRPRLLNGSSLLRLNSIYSTDDSSTDEHVGDNDDDEDDDNDEDEDVDENEEDIEADDMDEDDTSDDSEEDDIHYELVTLDDGPDLPDEEEDISWDQDRR